MEELKSEVLVSKDLTKKWQAKKSNIGLDEKNYTSKRKTIIRIQAWKPVVSTNKIINSNGKGLSATISSKLLKKRPLPISLSNSKDG